MKRPLKILKFHAVHVLARAYPTIPLSVCFNLCFFLSYSVINSTLFHLPPLRFHCVGDSEDAGFELRSVAEFKLAVRAANH